MVERFVCSTDYHTKRKPSPVFGLRDSLRASLAALAPVLTSSGNREDWLALSVRQGAAD